MLTPWPGVQDAWKDFVACDIDPELSKFVQSVPGEART